MKPTTLRFISLAGLGGLSACPALADEYDDLIASQNPLVYFALNDVDPATSAAATIDNTGPAYQPGATFTGTYFLGERSWAGMPAFLDPSGGFDGFGAANNWVNIGAIENVLVSTATGTPGGMRDGSGSVSMWVLFSGTGQQMLYYGTNETGGDGFGGQNELHVNTTGSGLLQFFTNTAGNGLTRQVTSVNSYNDQQWHHVVATWDAPTDVMTLYINGGAAAGGETLTNNMGNVSDNVEFTAAHNVGRPFTTTRGYSGWMDAVALWQRPLTATEVRYQYELAVRGDEDSDDDGMADAFELAYFGDLSRDGTDDDDNDGLDDLGESLAGTNPFVADTDGDGLSDGAEVNIHGSNPLLADTDGDGLSDGDEVNLHGTDPTLVDSDGDGLDDWFEITYFGNQDQGPNDDFDNDGLPNIVETGTGVWVSANDTGTNPANNDTDGDGLFDNEETNTGIFVSVANAGTNPLVADTDGDGLSDGDEVLIHNTSPFLADTDGDGFSDELEVLLGSDPNDPNSVPSPVFLGGGQWDITTVRDNDNQLDTFQEAIMLLNPFLTGGNGAIQGGIRNNYTANRINHSIAADGLGPAALGNYLPDQQFDITGFAPVDTDGAAQRIATLVEGEILITEAGTYTFLINSDDGHRLRINGIDGEIVTFDNSNHGPQNFVGSMDLPRGLHKIQLIHWNGGGSGSLELAIGREAGEIPAFTSLDDFMLLEPFDPTDTDDDGMPDQWEELYFGDLSRDGTADFDNDGLTDAEEFAARTDPTNQDTDGDGLLDGAEVKTHNTDPRLADTDNDGLTDGQEIGLALNPNLFDTDGDSFGDGAEVDAGTDPFDPGSFPAQGSIIWATFGDKGAEIEYLDPSSKFFNQINEFGFIRLLQENGYGVAIRDASQGNGYSDNNGGPNVAEANASDLIIISRNNNSGEYDSNNSAWNQITTPVLSLSAYVIRNSRLGWLPSPQDGILEFSTSDWTVEDALDPAFTGLGLSDDDVIDTAQGSASVNTGITNIGNATLVAVTTASSEQTAMLRWQAGVPFFTGGATPAGPRMYFAAGSGGANPSPGSYNLTDVGEAIFLNIVDDFVPDPVDGPFQAWMSQYQSAIIAETSDLGALLPAADPDGDGFTNLEELVFNLNPTLDSRPGIGNDPNSGNLPEFVDLGGGQFAIEFGSDPALLNAGSVGTQPIVLEGEISDDLVDWEKVQPTAIGGNFFRLLLPASEPAYFGRLFFEDPN